MEIVKYSLKQIAYLTLCTCNIILYSLITIYKLNLNFYLVYLSMKECTFNYQKCI